MDSTSWRESQGRYRGGLYAHTDGISVIDLGCCIELFVSDKGRTVAVVSTGTASFLWGADAEGERLRVPGCLDVGRRNCFDYCLLVYPCQTFGTSMKGEYGFIGNV